MRGCFGKWALSAVIMWLVVGRVGAQAVLEPPFGLRWGDSPEKLIAWASRHSLDVTISLPGDQPAIRVVRIQPKKGFISRFFSARARILGPASIRISASGI